MMLTLSDYCSELMMVCEFVTVLYVLQLPQLETNAHMSISKIASGCKW
jgi:hypothetical protein